MTISGLFDFWRSHSRESPGTDLPYKEPHGRGKMGSGRKADSPIFQAIFNPYCSQFLLSFHSAERSIMGRPSVPAPSNVAFDTALCSRGFIFYCQQNNPTFAALKGRCGSGLRASANPNLDRLIFAQGLRSARASAPADTRSAPSPAGRCNRDYPR